ncbi:MAG TPA: bifunctional molybdenum cofactor biosynthesis protein MoaC/MoaB [Spirochaetes bacterium]|nr:bifunctional molybdenum cofactor biosynthesis protein MoaC/MoaB [Spirochaetota bacterium]
MKDITGKQISLRTAQAMGKVLCSLETLERIKDNSIPKGNIFDLSKASGLLASKNTANLIPHCHPISIDSLDIDFELMDEEKDEKGVLIKVSGKSIGRTGMEMEVLTAVSITALTIYDLLKPIDKEIEITGIKLLEKTGGKSDKRYQPKAGTKAAVLVCSDSTAAGKREDKSGVIIQKMLKEIGVDIADYQIVPDEGDKIQKQIKSWVDKDIPFIFTSGGTGLGPRDHTVEAVKEIIERDADGITEVIRTYGNMRTPFAMLSRAIAGSISGTLIITLPGSSNGARESLEAIIPGVFHARKMLKGGGHS